MLYLLEPLRVIFALFESLVVFFGVIGNSQQLTMPGDYIFKLNRTGIFENRAQDAIPQTAMYGIILDHFTRERTDGKSPKCLVIGYDGARADALTVTKGDPKAGTQALKDGGGAVYNAFCGGNLPYLQPTITGPGWTTLLTGHWAKGSGGHGVADNDTSKPADGPKLIFTELLKRGLTGKTAFAVSWGGHFTDKNASYKYDIGYCAEKALNAEWFTEDNDEGTYERTLAEVKKSDAGMVMCILEYCDHNGHGTGPGTGFGNYNGNYVQGIKDSERDAYNLIQAVKARPTYSQEDWLILITTDHGGTFNGHGLHFADTRQTWLASNKKLDFGKQKKNWFIF